jgi:hypothetical protein
VRNSRWAPASVFADGLDLAAAEDVCMGNDVAADAILDLKDQSIDHRTGVRVGRPAAFVRADDGVPLHPRPSEQHRLPTASSTRGDQQHPCPADTPAG